MILFEIFLSKKSDPNIHQNAPNCTNFKYLFGGGGMPPNPPSKAHGFAMRSMSLRDMQISKSQKNSWLPPPLPNPGDAPVYRAKSTNT